MEPFRKTGALILFFCALSVLIFFGGGVRMMPLCAAAVFAALAALCLVTRPPRLPAAVWTSFFAVLAWSLACLFLSRNGIFGWKVFLLHAVYGCSFAAGAAFLSGEKQRPFVLAGVCLLGMGVVVYGYWRFGLGIEQIFGRVQPGEYRGRMSSLFVSPNHFAAFAGVIGLVTMGYALIAKKSAVRIFFGVCSGAALAGVILSGSRIGLGACVLVLAVLVLGRAVQFGRLVFLAIAGAAGVGIAAVIGFFHAGGVHRFSQGLQYWDASASARASVWMDSICLAMTRPLEGFGLGNFQWFYPPFRSVTINRKVDFAHSDILQTWVDQGAVGIVLWALLFGLCWWSARGDKRPLSAVMQAACVLAVLMAAVDFPFQLPAFGMVVFFMMGGLASCPAGGLCEEAGAPDVPPPRPARFVAGIGRIAGIALKGLAGLLLIFVLINAGRIWAGEWWVRRGESARGQLDWDRAIACFQKALWWNSSHCVAWKWMGEICSNRYLLSRRTWEAEGQQGEKYFRRSIDINARDGSVWLSLGLLLMDRGDFSRAEDALKKALSLDPKNAFFHDMMAKYLLSQGRFQEAAAHAAFALWLYPKDRVARTLLEAIKRTAYVRE